ncbi:MAG: hypothetical protein J6J18_03200 [Oscillospiraceae bacterium]|nr:hypothetical protein [Oscillospiraceae bacterium]
MDNQENTFEYTYSAPQQEEIKRIREKYLPKEEDKMEQLRRLDQSAVQKGQAVSLIVGVIGALVLGLGMSCCMVWGGDLFIPGIIIGVVGLVGVSLAYPLYARITERERKKIAPEILRLTEELMK